MMMCKVLSGGVAAAVVAVLGGGGAAAAGSSNYCYDAQCGMVTVKKPFLGRASSVL